MKQALDILAPVMSERMNDADSSDNWLKWPRRILSEDGFNVTQVLNVYQFIVQHPDLFFVAREHFVSNIITAMGKLTILANPAIENQVLAIELAELILYWERKAKDSKEESQATQEDENIEEDKEEATATTTTAADEVRPEEISPLLQTIQFHLVKEKHVSRF